MSPTVALLLHAPLSWVLTSASISPDGINAGYYNGATTWTSASSFNLSASVVRWSMPPSAFSTDALGRGLSYALHPDFCEHILPAFAEDNAGFSGLSGMTVTCDDLHAAVASAFDVWSANHASLHFVDVSALCTDTSAYVDSRCTSAELTIFSDLSDPNPFEGERVAAYVRNGGGRNFNGAPFLTSGRQQVPGFGIRGSDMTVSTKLCWYLDATFCSNFHQLGDSGTDVLALVRAIIAAVCVISAIVLAVIVVTTIRGSARELKHQRARDGGTPSRCDALLLSMSKVSLCWVLLPLFFLIAAPLFYATVFIPCWDCYDFKATIAHEVGHVLGFDHPDRHEPLNLRAMAPMGASSCDYPLQAVELAPLPGPATSSIMYSSTLHRGRSCLSQDDLEGLNFLYPLCTGALATPICKDTPQYSGYLRFTIVLVVPYIFVSLGLFLTQLVVRRSVTRRLKTVEQEVQRVSRERSTLRREAERLQMQLSSTADGQPVPPQPRSARRLLGRLGVSVQNALNSVLSPRSRNAARVAELTQTHEVDVSSTIAPSAAADEAEAADIERALAASLVTAELDASHRLSNTSASHCTTPVSRTASPSRLNPMRFPMSRVSTPSNLGSAQQPHTATRLSQNVDLTRARGLSQTRSQGSSPQGSSRMFDLTRARGLSPARSQGSSPHGSSPRLSVSLGRESGVPLLRDSTTADTESDAPPLPPPYRV